MRLNDEPKCKIESLLNQRRELVREGNREGAKNLLDKAKEIKQVNGIDKPLYKFA